MVFQKHSHKNSHQGSALIFALIIMALILTATFSLVAVTSIERKNSGATAKSVAAFQIANNGVEKVLKRVYKDNDATINALSSALGGEACVGTGSCSNGCFKVVNAAAGWEYSVTLLKDDSTPLTCTQTDWKTSPPGSSITMGETNILATNDSGNANTLLAQPATLSQTATLQSVSFYINALGGNLRLGVFDATGSSGGPGQLRAETNSFTPAVTGWRTENVVTPVSLTAGTYWLAYLPSSGALGYRWNNTSSSHRKYGYTFGPLPATFSSAPGNQAGHWSFYATLSVGAASSTIPLHSIKVTGSYAGTTRAVLAPVVFFP